MSDAELLGRIEWHARRIYDACFYRRVDPRYLTDVELQAIQPDAPSLTEPQKAALKAVARACIAALGTLGDLHPTDAEQALSQDVWGSL